MAGRANDLPDWYALSRQRQDRLGGRRPPPVALVLQTFGAGQPIGVDRGGTHLYGAGNGIYSIARRTVPLALFGSERYAPLLGRLARRAGGPDPGPAARRLRPRPWRRRRDVHPARRPGPAQRWPG